MKNLIIKILLVCISTVALFSSPILFAENKVTNTQNNILLQHSNNSIITNPILTPPAPTIDASAYILVDAQSGKVIAQKNATKKIPPASLTKMMTLYVISSGLKANHFKLNDEVTISKKAWKTGGSRMFIKVGQKVKVIDLLQGIIVASGNDACVAMAEFIAGDEKSFASLMNQQAKAIGMKNSHFTDSTGLPDPNHYSTATDLAILASALINDFPEYYGWYKQKWFTYNNIKQPNRNRLLWRDKNVDGLKTGHTKSAGYCLVSSAKKANQRLVSVVMGAPSDDERSTYSQKLLNYGFRFFETHKLYTKGQTIDKPKVWKGQKTNIGLIINQNLYITIPTGQYNKVKIIKKLPENITAPIKKGQKIGTLIVKFDNKEVNRQTLIANSNNPLGGYWSRIKDSISMFISNYTG